jgi:hypothetical protein
VNSAVEQFRLSGMRCGLHHPELTPLLAWVEALQGAGLADAECRPNRDAPSLLLRHTNRRARGSFARIEHHLRDRHDERSRHLFVKVSPAQVQEHAPRAAERVHKYTGDIRKEIGDFSQMMLAALTAAFVEAVDQRAAARSPSGPASRRRQTRPPRTVRVDFEGSDEYEVRLVTERRSARQRHKELVRIFCTYLDRLGREFESIAATRAGREIKCDVYDRTRHILFEAKASVERTEIRMALGQLLDYSLFLFDDSKRESLRLSLLLPEQPPSDVRRLAERAGVGIAWRSGDRFVERNPQ